MGDSAQSKGEQKKNVPKVDPKTAKDEFESWLYGVRRVRETLLTEKNPDLVESVENCVQNIVDGVFTINAQTGEVTQKLRFPIGEDFDEPVTELVYKPRMKANAFDKSRKYKNPDDTTRMKICMASLCGKPLSIIDKAEYADVSIASDLMIFYLVG